MTKLDKEILYAMHLQLNALILALASPDKDRLDIVQNDAIKLDETIKKWMELK